VSDWFTGLNPELGDRVPARLLREKDVETVGPESRARILGRRIAIRESLRRDL